MKKLLLTGLGALALTMNANALLTGGFSLSGGYIARDAANNPVTDLSLATQVEFGNVPGGTPDSSATNGTGVGSFAGIPDGTPVTYVATTLSFTPPNTPLTPFFTVPGFSFSLDTISRTFANANSLILDGTGIFNNTAGTDPTPGTYTASFNTIDGTFSYSASVGTVPDGGSALALLGMSLAGAEVLRRKFAV